MSQQILLYPNLLLNDHVPEVLEGQRLGSLAGDEGLLKVRKGDLARVHVTCFRRSKQLRLKGKVVVVKGN